ncbi:heterokaryon incompatibility protein-domain-containing protein [Sordaria brevicollis]|uniref:Heterokaryon incompatibility protein-domain-containing protein n=1 Tax=Sordaria brevicollis TaxID=83679 RepID=A0AAE0PGL0_SORBR|nr:heterokaryon incompatibility protein-domain-containing protein [Sordaria brevicollis]
MFTFISAMDDISLTMDLHDQGDFHQASPGQLSAPDGAGSSTESSQPPETTKFCSKCQGISAKLEELLDQGVFSTDRQTRRVTSEGDLGHVVELSQKAQCSLCGFLSHMVEAYRVSQGNWWAISEVALYVGSAKRRYLEWNQHVPEVHDSLLLWIWPARESFMYEHDWELLLPFSRRAKYGSAGIALELTDDPNKIRGEPIGPRANFELIRSWVDECITNHQTSPGLPDVCKTNASVVLDIPGFMVIDCSSRTLVYWSQIPERKDCAYVALSYVWGTKPTSDDEVGPADSANRDHNMIKTTTQNPDPTNERQLPSSLPPLIEDAITAVISLRYRYLWVDRYCIQNDPQTKHAQIQSMDKIYGSATLTIVAAEGNDPSFGLPGVSPRSELPTSVRIGSRTFVTVGTPGLAEKVKGSKWNTRAWTMQEGFLSSRCLFLMESGAYYQCNFPLSQRYESMREPPALSRSKDRFNNCLWGNDDSLVFTKGARYHGQIVGPYLRLPSGYFVRHLTFEDDSINALSGILTYLKSIKVPIYDLWGLLIIPEQDDWTSNGPTYRYNLVQSLAWSYVRDQSFSKTKLRQPTILPRKHIFPSWSWVDWRSRTALDGQCFNSTHTLQLSAHHFFTSLVDITLELNEGGTVHWENGNVADTSWLATVSQHPRVLIIHGYSCNTQLRNVTEEEWGEFCDKTFPSKTPPGKESHEQDRQSSGHRLGCKTDRKWVMIDSDGKHLQFPFEITENRRPWCWAERGGFVARNLSIDAYHLKLQHEQSAVANDEIFHSTTFELRVILLGHDRNVAYFMVLLKSPVTDTSSQQESFERVNVVTLPFLPWKIRTGWNDEQACREAMERLLSHLERKHDDSSPGTPWEKMTTRVI